MILSVIQHAGTLSARPRQYRLLTTLMYDAITELIKASSGNTVPVVVEGWRWCIIPPAVVTSLSLPNQRLEMTMGTSMGLIFCSKHWWMWQTDQNVILHTWSCSTIHYTSVSGVMSLAEVMKYYISVNHTVDKYTKLQKNIIRPYVVYGRPTFAQVLQLGKMLRYFTWLWGTHSIYFV